MTPESQQLSIPQPHDLPVPSASYTGWTFAGIAVYVVFLAAAAGAAVLWHEIRCLRRAAEALLLRITEARDEIRRKEVTR